MTALRRLFLLIRLWYVESLRHASSAPDSPMRWISFVGYGLIGLLALGFGIVTELATRWLPPDERSLLLHTLLLWMILCWPLILALWQSGPRIRLRPWLLWPVSRSWLAHALQLFSTCHMAQSVLGLFFLGFWWGHIAFRFEMLSAFGWLLVASLLITCAQWAANLLRLLRTFYPGLFVVVWLGGLVGIGMLSAQGYLTALALHTLMAPLKGHVEGPGILLLLNLMLYFVGFLLTRNVLYVDDVSQPSLLTIRRTERPRKPSMFRRLVQLQVQLLWRHRITRLVFFLPIIYGVIGGIHMGVGLKNNALPQLLIGSGFLMLASVQFLSHMWSYLSTFADGLFTWPVSSRLLGSTALSIAATLSLLAFLTGFVSWMLLMHAFGTASSGPVVLPWSALYLYLVGLVHPIHLLQTPHYAVRLELHPKALSRGPAGRNSLRLIGSILLMIGLGALALSVGTYGWLGLGLTGIAGLFLYPNWLELLELRLNRNKYDLLMHLRRH